MPSVCGSFSIKSCFLAALLPRHEEHLYSSVERGRRNVRVCVCVCVCVRVCVCVCV